MIFENESYYLKCALSSVIVHLQAVSSLFLNILPITPNFSILVPNIKGVRIKDLKSNESCSLYFKRQF